MNKILLFVSLVTMVITGCTQLEENTLNMSLMQECSDDLNNDSEKEIIRLYATIEKDEDREFLFDDSEVWQLIVKNHKGDICIYQRRIQMGFVHFCVCRNCFGKKLILVEDTVDDITIREIRYSFFLRKYISKTVSTSRKAYPHYIFQNP